LSRVFGLSKTVELFAHLFLADIEYAAHRKSNIADNFFTSRINDKS